MKFRRHIMGVLLIPLILLAGCVDFYYAARPRLDVNEQWVSTEPNIMFTSEENLGHVGALITDDEVIEISVYFDHGTGIDIYQKPRNTDGKIGAPVIRGQCRFSKDQLVVEVTSDPGNLLNGAETITFDREEISARDSEVTAFQRRLTYHAS